LTVFIRIWGNNEFVTFKNKQIQNKMKYKAPQKRNKGEAIGMFLAWMALYWMFICILALSLLSAA